MDLVFGARYLEFLYLDLPTSSFFLRYLENQMYHQQGDTPYSDVECPTKRASLWADMILGRQNHVPANI